MINAGDGKHEHPTQALLDMLTLRDRFGKIEGLKVAICGDVLHSRVARSNIWGLKKLGAEVAVTGPASLLPRDIERLGVQVFARIEDAMQWADALNVLRLQLERVVPGFDGVDPRIVKEYVDRGELPAMAALIATGGLHELASEIPPESPVAWASILTGVNPGRHGIFDFVVRDPATTGYKPVNGMVDLVPPRFLLGAVPTRPPRVASRLAHETFLERVAREGYRTLGLRPPLAFPVRPTPGARLLSGLGTPDLAGTNGAYAIYSSGLGLGREYTMFNGHRIHLEGGPGATVFDTYLEGPYDRRRREADGGYSRLTTPLRFSRSLPDGPVVIETRGERAVVAVGETSPWMSVAFRLPTIPPWTFRGRVRFRVQSVEPLDVLAEPVQPGP